MRCLGTARTRQIAADAPTSEIAAHLKKFTKGLKAGITDTEMYFEHTGEEGLVYEGKDVSGGYFGEFGGRYIPETLVEAHRLVRSGGSATGVISRSGGYRCACAWVRVSGRFSWITVLGSARGGRSIVLRSKHSHLVKF